VSREPVLGIEPSREDHSPRTAVLLEAYNAVYIEVPKVACSSIRIALASLLGIDLNAAGVNSHEVDFPEPRPQAGPGLYPGLFAFAFVRNPWDRVVSCYRDKILGEVRDFTRFHPTRDVAYCLAGSDAFQGGMPFEGFVEVIAATPDGEADEHFRSQQTFVTDDTRQLAVDFLGRFERLDQDFQRVCQEVGIGGLRLPFVQAAPTPRDCKEYYTPSTQRLVGERFADDIKLFDYSFGASD
jgi:hypothetical protein